MRFLYDKFFYLLNQVMKDLPCYLKVEASYLGYNFSETTV